MITGFLGAGKTTLLRALLQAQHGLRIGVVLNEFGEAGIDDVGAARQAYIELTDGCACCLRNPDLVKALTELAARSDVDHAIVETSGLADPLPLTWTVQKPELDGLVRLDAVITLVDAANHAQAAREEWESQVRCADVVVVSKLDLAGDAATQLAIDAVRSVNPAVRVVETGPGLPVPVLLDAVTEPHARTLAPRPAQHSDFDGFEIGGRLAYRLNDLEDLLAELPREVFRVKGRVRTEAGRWVELHVVGGRVTLDLHAKEPAHGDSRILVFGRGVDEAAVREAFARCVA
jgi:G3E family GTPase